MSEHNCRIKLPFTKLMPEADNTNDLPLSETELAIIHKEQLLMSIIDEAIITDAKAILEYPTKQQWLIDMTILKRLGMYKNEDEFDLKK